jgi:hypothetical protein
MPHPCPSNSALLRGVAQKRANPVDERRQLLPVQIRNRKVGGSNPLVTATPGESIPPSEPAGRNPTVLAPHHKAR